MLKQKMFAMLCVVVDWNKIINAQKRQIWYNKPKFHYCIVFCNCIVQYKMRDNQDMKKISRKYKWSFRRFVHETNYQTCSGFIKKRLDFILLFFKNTVRHNKNKITESLYFWITDVSAVAFGALLTNAALKRGRRGGRG